MDFRRYSTAFERFGLASIIEEGSIERVVFPVWRVLKSLSEKICHGLFSVTMVPLVELHFRMVGEEISSSDRNQSDDEDSAPGDKQLFAPEPLT